MSNNVKRADERLHDASETYKQRNAVYKDSYKKHGKVMAEFFPDGINLENKDDFNRYMLFETIVGKLVRYANNFKKGGHQDSIHDNGVYSFMLEEVDEEVGKALEAGKVNIIA